MFKIKIRDHQDQKQLVPISSLYASYCNLTYLEVISNRISVRSTICESGYCRVTLVDEALMRTKPSITDRIIYKPIFKKSDQKPIEPKVHLGSIKGIAFKIIFIYFRNFLLVPFLYIPKFTSLFQIKTAQHPSS